MPWDREYPGRRPKRDETLATLLAILLILSSIAISLWCLKLWGDGDFTGADVFVALMLLSATLIGRATIRRQKRLLDEARSAWSRHQS
jgi:hypothetical protein